MGDRGTSPPRGDARRMWRKKRREGDIGLTCGWKRTRKGEKEGKNTKERKGKQRLVPEEEEEKERLAKR